MPFASQLRRRRARAAQLLRHGDTGVLKVAGSPQHIESVLSGLLHHYAKRSPKVEVRISEGTGSEILTLLERGEIHLGQNLLHAVKLDERQFGSLPLGSVELLAVCHPSTPLGRRRTIEVAGLTDFPLLLMHSGFGFRRAFDAASRMAGLKSTVMFESRTPHTLLALAEAGHGVAIVPSPVQPLPAPSRRSQVQGPSPAGASDDFLGQETSIAPLCNRLLRHARHLHAQSFPISRPTEPSLAPPGQTQPNKNVRHGSIGVCCLGGGRRHTGHAPEPCRSHRLAAYSKRSTAEIGVDARVPRSMKMGTMCSLSPYDEARQPIIGPAALRRGGRRRYAILPVNIQARVPPRLDFLR